MNSVIAMVSSVSICAVTTILGAFVSEGGVKTELMMATATIVVLSMIILFIFARKHIVNGVARGGLKEFFSKNDQIFATRILLSGNYCL